MKNLVVSSIEFWEDKYLGYLIIAIKTGHISLTNNVSINSDYKNLLNLKSLKSQTLPGSFKFFFIFDK